MERFNVTNRKNITPTEKGQAVALALSYITELASELCLTADQKAALITKRGTIVSVQLSGSDKRDRLALVRWSTGKLERYTCQKLRVMSS